MIKTIWVAGLALMLALGIAACGGGSEDSASNDAQPAVNAEPQTTPPAPQSQPGDAQTTPPAAAGTYVTQHDPNAVYTKDDITLEGSYLKLNLEDLTDDQMNRVIHRLRTELCTCGCIDDPIDQCLINDSACGTAVTLANQVIREEKSKS